MFGEVFFFVRVAFCFMIIPRVCDKSELLKVYVESVKLE